jgi:hypothetical protein
MVVVVVVVAVVAAAAAVAAVVHVKWITCHHGTSSQQVVYGGDGLQLWKVAANILCKQSRTANKGGSPALALG